MKNRNALKYILPCLIAGVLSTNPAHAIMINFDLDDGTIFVNPEPNYSSNAVSLGGPVALSPGQPLEVWINFVDRETGAKQHLEIIDLGDPADETFGVSAAGNNIANGPPLFDVEFSGVMGDVIGTVFQSNSGDCFNATTCVSSTFPVDLTDTSFLLHNIHITLTLPSAQSGPATIESVQFGFALDNDTTASAIGVWDIPEPGTLALFGLGLAGLGFARRGKAA